MTYEPKPTLTAHALGRRLLALADLPVAFMEEGCHSDVGGLLLDGDKLVLLSTWQDEDQMRRDMELAAELAALDAAMPKGWRGLSRGQMEELLDASDTPLPCMMLDGKVALLISFPGEDMADTRYGFQVPEEPDIRWRRLPYIKHLGGGALAEMPAPPTQEELDAARPGSQPMTEPPARGGPPLKPEELAPRRAASLDRAMRRARGEE